MKKEKGLSNLIMHNPDKFSYIGAFSGGSIFLDEVNNTPGLKEKVKLVFISFGSRKLGGTGSRDEAHSVAIRRRMRMR